MEEVWKDIEGYEGLYQVSNLGRVKSLPKPHKFVHGYYLTKEKILSPRVCGTQREYLSFALQRDGEYKQIKIHRLVAQAFIPNPNNLPEVNHIDENKGNNKADNLEWCTCSYNIRHGYSIGLAKSFWKGKNRDNKTIEKIRTAKIGTKQNEEWKRKKAAKKGVNHPLATKVLQYDLQGNFIREYNLVKEAAEANGLKLNNISACLRGKSKTSGGYIWKYATIK